MDFKDWRTSETQPVPEAEVAATYKKRGQRFSDYIEEQIHDAQKRGIFDNLRGMGQPLNLDENPYAGDKALGYSLLKGSGHAPAEVELSREIRQGLERLDAQRLALSRRGQELRRRRVTPFASEKRAYNNAVAKALEDYEAKLRDLNSKILTLNLTTPTIMHRPPLNIEQMLNEFREACPSFA